MARIAVVAASGFDQDDMTIICRELAKAGHSLAIVSPKKHEVRAWANTRWGADMPVDVAAVDAKAADYDAVIMPGGVLGADTLRADRAVVDLVSACAAQGKPVAALGHAPWVLVEAGLLKGRAATSHPAIRTDVVNAGARWTDAAAVTDDRVTTGRHGHDAQAFAEEALKRLRT